MSRTFFTHETIDQYHDPHRPDVLKAGKGYYQSEIRFFYWSPLVMLILLGVGSKRFLNLLVSCVRRRVLMVDQK